MEALTTQTKRMKITPRNNARRARGPRLSLNNRINKRLAERTPKFTFHSLDENSLSKVFEFVPPTQLAKAAAASKAFNNESPQNPSWKRLYLSKYKAPDHGEKENERDWKRLFVGRLRSKKNQALGTFVHKVMARARTSHGLPDTRKLIRALNLKYQVFIDNVPIAHDKQITKIKKVSKIKKAVTNTPKVRSFAFSTVLKVANGSKSDLSQFPMRRIRSIRVRLSSPRLFEPIDVCFPVQSADLSALQNLNETNSNQNKKDVLQLNSHRNLHFALYDADSIGFVVIGLNHYALLSHIAPEQMSFARMSPTVRIDRSACYGWKCQMLFRNLKTVFFQSEFFEVIPVPATDNSALTEFKLIDLEQQFDHQKLDIFPVYPWKSDLFKGKEIGVFEVDVVLLNHENRVLVAESLMVSCVETDDLYNFTDQSNGDKRYLMRHQNLDRSEVFRSLSANIVFMDAGNYELQALSLFCSFAV